MHFWVFATRGQGAFSTPRKYGLNWFIPAFVNSSVGSSCGTTGELGTNVWPCRLTKKSMNCLRMSAEEGRVMNASARLKVPDYSASTGGVQGAPLHGLPARGLRTSARLD